MSLDEKCKNKGSMTVEATIVLPIFLFFFLALMSLLDMIRLQGNISIALWNTGRELAIYSGTHSEAFKNIPPTGHHQGEQGQEETGNSGKKGDNNDLFEDVLVGYGYVKQQLVHYLGKDYLEDSPLKRGASSLQFIESDIFTAGGDIDLVVTYEVSPLVSIPGFWRFRMANRYYGHSWGGYGGTAVGIQQDEEEVLVYVTKNSEVYHLTSSCSNLLLKIRATTPILLDQERNNGGSKYKACEYCGKGKMPSEIYVSSEGDKYHYSKDCQGLKRTYSVVPLSEVEMDHRPCSRCGG